MATVRLANAPVSYGVFEMTADGGSLPPSDALLAAVAQAGYRGVDLGPIGYLGGATEIKANLGRHGLELVGGWVDLHLSSPVLSDQDRVKLEQALEIFSDAAGAEPVWRPKPTLADSGDLRRRGGFGQASRRRDLELDDDHWRCLAANVRLAAQICRDHGLEPTFHHHLGTYVESPREIERFLEVTDVSLCLDTGHLFLGGGDPIQAWKDWRIRINHIHVKDARRDVLEKAISEGASMDEAWRRGIFCRLGEGDVDLDGFIAAVSASDYAGWVVVEQDVIPQPGTPLSVPAGDQVANREFLRARGW